MLCKASYARVAQATQEGEALPLPNGKVGQGYEYELGTEGGLPPFAWRVVSGELPPGISLETSGKLKGVPSVPRREAYSFAVEVSDSSQPSRRAERHCLLRIEAAPLRVVGGASKLRIVPQAKNSEPRPENVSADLASGSSADGNQPGAGNQAQYFSWPIVAPKSSVNEKTEVLRALQSDGNTGKAADKFDPLDPLNIVRIYEIPRAGSKRVQSEQDAEIQGKLIYDGTGRHPDLRSTRLTADETSSIAIFPALSGRDIAFNTIYMAAELSSGDTKQDIEVENYSEVGTAPSADAFVIGASFESAKNILDKMITLQRRLTDIIKHILELPELHEVTEDELKTLVEILRMSDAERDRLLARATEALDLYSPEIESISTYLVSDVNRDITERVANNLFHMDRDTFIAIAKQFRADSALVQSKDVGERNNAIRRLLARLVQVYKDFRAARAEILDMSTTPPGDQADNREKARLVAELRDLRARIAATSNPSLKKGLEEEARKKARDIYAYDKSIEAIISLRQTKFPKGWVSLEEARAKDGDILKLTVRVQNPAGAGTGNKVPFYIAVKKYGVKLHWASSFMFIKRLGITEEDQMPDANGNILSEVNFAPSPGVSYGITYFKRGDSGGSKFLRALAPTIGINVSFMNFDDPGFDLQTGMFTNTTGTDVQVGTGPTVSLFNNKLHFIPVGWNLNTDRKRRYWGIGFGFVEFAKELGKVLKSTGSGSTQ